MNMTEVGEHDLKIDNDRHKIFNMTEKKNSVKFIHISVKFKG